MAKYPLFIVASPRSGASGLLSASRRDGAATDCFASAGASGLLSASRRDHRFFQSAPTLWNQHSPDIAANNLIILTKM
ncbi:MAG TPA: hypothetical protein VMU18_11305 [Rhodoblastus sp.]|nr:hypothetical protein [Rhodoblastus sp.]